MKILRTDAHGAGWSSWIGKTRDERKFCCEYQPLIDFVEKYGSYDIPTALLDQFKSDFYAKFPEAEVRGVYLGGADDLIVVEVPDGSRYRISEYDGFEMHHLESDEEWL